MVVQGDVYFTRADKLPEGLIAIEKTKRGYIIAEGEATGHAHVVADTIEFYEAAGVLYLKTERAVKVRHEKHKPVILNKGIWKAGRVREYDPFEEESRRVRD